MTIRTSQPLAGRGVRPTPSPEPTTRETTGADRRAGRRAISLALLLTGVFAVISGFWALLPPHSSSFALAHTAGGCVFGVLSLVHVRYNRNALRLYLRDLGWSPAVLRLVIAAAISLVLLVPVLRLV